MSLRFLLFALLSAPVLAAEPKLAVLDVSGMTCSLCPITVRKALERVPGVLEAKADFDAKRAEAKYDPDKVSPETLAAAVTKAGFPAKVKQP
jgi:periplasmic mercuric ion binding protein